MGLWMGVSVGIGDRVAGPLDAGLGGERRGLHVKKSLQGRFQ
jgi:hypothetical protein